VEDGFKKEACWRHTHSLSHSLTHLLTHSLSLTCAGAGFLLWELSTPFVHYRWFLLKSGQTKTRTYVTNGVIMGVVFLACRPIWGTFLSYKVST
jgi:hypothetical protein